MDAFTSYNLSAEYYLMSETLTVYIFIAR